MTTWLDREIEKYRHEDPYFQAVRLGLMARYYSLIVSPTEREVIVAQLKSGQTPAHRFAIREQAVRVDANVVVDRALSSLHLMGRELHDLQQELLPLDPDWRAAFVAACIRRDDIECVREVLAYLDRNDLDLPLRAADEHAMNFVSVIPVGFDPHNARLLHALARDGDVWWTWPVQTEDHILAL